MKSPYVSELQPNEIVTATLLVQSKEIRQKKTGEPYLSLILSDRTGEVEAKMFDNAAEVMETFDRDDYLRIRGLLQIHHNRLQLTIHKLQKQLPASIDCADFFPASERSSDEMYEELRAVVAEIGNPHLHALATAMVEDPEIQPRLRMAPAARNVHHAYLGGLLEHVLSMCKLGKLTAQHYRNVDTDLLMTGIVLHDIGKVHELTYEGSFGYSSDGQLLGHIFIGLRMIDEKIRSIVDFPARLRTLLEHMILSHHGELAYGSPKVPLFPEALLLHHLDNLDSKMECMRGLLQRDRIVEGCWTTYSNILERSILKKSKYLETADEAPVEAKGAAAAAAAQHVPQTPFAQKLLGALGGKP